MSAKGMRSEVAVVRYVGVGDTVFAGAFAGGIGGLLVLLVAMTSAAINGMDILSPIRLIGSTFVGAGALQGGASTIGFGLVLHLIASITWGIGFAALLPRVTSIAAAFVAGLTYGLVVMLVMLYLVLPLANPLMREAVDGTNAFTVAHLAFGAALSLVPLFRYRLALRFG